MAVISGIREDILQFVWQYKLLAKSALKTRKGEPLLILSPGQLNKDAGPDFLFAKIKIGDEVLAGHVEIHVHASDWKKHGHHLDPAYRNVILHVFLVPDKNVDHHIPELCLADCIHTEWLITYRKLMESKLVIPCSPLLPLVDIQKVRAGFSRLVITRLQSKSAKIIVQWEENNRDWSEILYQLIAKYLGGRVNAGAMEQLAIRLPQRILAKHHDSLFQTEALLFGTSGLLPNTPMDDYSQSLKGEFSFLAAKYQLHPLNEGTFAFSKMMPRAFPTIRIAQLASLVHLSSHLFSKILEAESIEQFKKLFEVKPSSYWIQHLRFCVQQSKPSHKSIGNATILVILINTVLPIIYAYASVNNLPELEGKVLAWLDQLPAEHNSIIKEFSVLGITAKSAFDSQAVIQLKNEQCDRKKCLLCHIGFEILKN